MEILPHNHQKFIELVATGISKTEAYRQAVSPDAMDATCTSNGHKLAQRYAKQIAEMAEQRRIAMGEGRDNAWRELGADLVTESEAVERLSNIIRGRACLEGNDQALPDYHDVLRALDLYFRLMGSFPTKTEIHATTAKHTVIAPDKR